MKRQYLLRCMSQLLAQSGFAARLVAPMSLFRRGQHVDRMHRQSLLKYASVVSAGVAFFGLLSPAQIANGARARATTTPEQTAGPKAHHLPLLKNGYSTRRTASSSMASRRCLLRNSGERPRLRRAHLHFLPLPRWASHLRPLVIRGTALTLRAQICSYLLREVGLQIGYSPR